MHATKRLLTAVLVACLSALLLAPVSANAQGWQDDPADDSTEVLQDSFQDRPEDSTERPHLAQTFAHGERALNRMGHRLPAVAQAHGLGTTELRTMLSTDETLFVDGAGELVYFDELAPGEPTPTAPAAAEPTATPPASGPEFLLASNPGALKTIFLDFNGHVTQGTTWNSRTETDTIVSAPYDTDDNPGTWSAAELDVIAQSWAVVAEDYAPWNVNVTTIDPGPDALRRTGSGDSQWGIRVVITTDNVIACACGGAAYIGSFDDPADEPAYVFNSNFQGVSQAISHEVGHSLLLAHDGTSTAGYYRGHVSADTVGWVPIMGSGYWQPLSQWSQQEYFDANNTGTDANFGNGHDDIAIISSMTNGNDFGLKLDDHGDTVGAATAITESTAVTGLIGTRQDRDVFSLTTTGGLAEFGARPAALGPNLDIALTVRDSTGAILATDNPPTTLSAAVSLELPAGDYTIEIAGVGVGAPQASTPSGYSDYGSIGQYSLTATVDDAALAQVMGDVNCDGRSSVADALFVAQFAVGNRTGSDQCPLADPTSQIYIASADVNANGRVSVADALLISQCVVGQPNTFCPE